MNSNEYKMAKIKDLTFIDIGLPSGKKISIDLVENLYKVEELYTKCRDFLPTLDDIKELLLFCKIEPATKEIAEDDCEDNVQHINGINIIGSKTYFFLPFLGEINSDTIIQDNEASLLLLKDEPEDDINMYAVMFNSNNVILNDVYVPKESYIQTILIKNV